MTDVQWLLIANLAVWLGLGAYLAFLLRAQNTLDERVRRLELLRDE